MDQVKEYVRLAIKYRFWIAVGLAALLPIIAYLVGAGPIQEKAKAETAKIKGSDTAVKEFASGVKPNKQYQPIVDDKTQVLTKDVNASWKKLYERQAPLLTWPDRVEDEFKAWGRAYPKDIDPSTITLTINDYVQAYPAYVTKVYNSFHPFNPEDGSGVVSAPPEAALLSPAVFDTTNLPTLTDVWGAQERLWIQNTLLDVVAQVNKDAKSWDNAIIKQVDMLDVGSPTAIDQKSVAKGEVPEKAPDIVDPNKPVDPAADPAAAGGAAPMPGGGMLSGPGGKFGGMGMGATPPGEVYYVKGSGDQFRIMPVQMTVLMEQDHIQDLFVALENSPMTVQVREFDLSKPGSRVVKPVKGETGQYGGMMGMMGGGMAGYAGRGEGSRPSYGMGGMMSGYGGRANAGASYGGMAMSGGYGGRGMMGGAGAAEPARKGQDARGTNRAEDAKKRAAAATKNVGFTIQDPYYNVVAVTVIGQARFFNPPPKEEPQAEPSQAETPATPPAEGADAAKTDEAAKKDDAAKAEETKKDEAAPEKKEEATPEKKDDAPKAEGTPEKKDDAPKAEEAKKAEEPKAEEAKKDEAAKAGEPKKDDAPKPADEPKKDETPKR